MHSHAWHVTNHAIMLSKYADDPVTLVWSAALHDIGIPHVKGRKIVESEIEQASPENKTLLENEARRYREAHMEIGRKIASDITRSMRARPLERCKVSENIVRHDMWKLEDVTDYSHDAKLLIECDVLWCFTHDGIIRDLERDEENGIPPKSFDEQFEYNAEKFHHRLNYGLPIYETYKENRGLLWT